MESEVFTTLFRLVISLIAGGIIGLERSYNGRPAGFRTHSLVCMSSSMLMLLTVYQWSLLADAPLETIRVDPTRMAQGIMTGIGFLGAGVIMKERNSIRGLTTSASIWVTASIGILIGMGFYVPALAATILAVGTLSIFRKLERRIPTLQLGTLTVRTLRKSKLQENDILKVVEQHKFSTSNRCYSAQDEGKYIEFTMAIHTRENNAFKTLAEALIEMKDILDFSVTPNGN